MHRLLSKMRKISAMYKWSGGTDYAHTCHECKNCVKMVKASKNIYKCLVYGNTNSEASDWKASYIACKHFNGPVPERSVLKGIHFKKEEKEKEIEGQLSLDLIV